jgi:hypothetical protein
MLTTLSVRDSKMLGMATGGLPGASQTKICSFGWSDNARYRAVQYVPQTLTRCTAGNFESIGAGSFEKD